MRPAPIETPSETHCETLDEQQNVGHAQGFLLALVAKTSLWQIYLESSLPNLSPIQQKVMIILHGGLLCIEY